MPCVRTLDSRDRSPLYIAPLFCPTGYFGCRDNATGGFDGEKFKVAAARPQVKLIEIKLSQGAKPSHGTHPPTNPHARTHARTHTHTHTQEASFQQPRSRRRSPQRAAYPWTKIATPPPSTKSSERPRDSSSLCKGCAVCTLSHSPLCLPTAATTANRLGFTFGCRVTEVSQVSPTASQSASSSASATLRSSHPSCMPCWPLEYTQIS